MASKKEQKVSRNGRRLLIVYLFEINKDKKKKETEWEIKLWKESEKKVYAKYLAVLMNPKIRINAQLLQETPLSNQQAQ